jgi:hypothetical protein
VALRLAVESVSAMAMNQGTIRVTREERGRRDRLRAYQVRVDGHVVAKIRRAQTIELEASSGTHTVQIAIDWTRSPIQRVDLRPGQTVELHCAPNTGIAPLSAITFRRSHYVSLWRPGDTDGAPPQPQRRTPRLQFVILGLLLTALIVSAGAGRTGDSLIIGLWALLPACVIGLWIYTKRRD